MRIKRLLIILVFLFLPLKLYAAGWDSPSGFDTGSTFDKITIREKPAPNADTNTGKLYVATDNSLHYLSETGTDTQVVGDTGVVGGGGGGWTDSAPHVTVTDTTDNVSIGTSTANAKLDVQGSAIFNDDGADVDFRVEGDTDANLLKVDAGLDYVGVGTDTPTSKLDVNGTITTNTEIRTPVIISTAADGAHRGNVSNSNEYTGGNEVEGDEHYDKTDNRKEFYDGTVWWTKGRLECFTKTITEPDLLATDTLILKHYMAESYSDGAVIEDIVITYSQAGTDTHILEEWADELGAGTSTVESIALSGDTRKEDDGTLSDPNIAADAYLALRKDAAQDNIDYMTISWTSYRNAD